MKLEELIDLASFAAAIDHTISNTDYEDIQDFAKTWHDLLDADLDDLHLSRLDLEEQDRDYLSIGGQKL